MAETLTPDGLMRIYPMWLQGWVGVCKQAIFSWLDDRAPTMGIAVNQTSVFLATKPAAEQMAKPGGGSIVNISPIMGFVGGASGHPAYSASKGAVRIYSKSAGV